MEITSAQSATRTTDLATNKKVLDEAGKLHSKIELVLSPNCRTMMKYLKGMPLQLTAPEDSSRSDLQTQSHISKYMLRHSWGVPRILFSLNMEWPGVNVSSMIPELPQTLLAQHPQSGVIGCDASKCSHSSQPPHQRSWTWRLPNYDLCPHKLYGPFSTQIGGSTRVPTLATWCAGISCPIWHPFCGKVGGWCLMLLSLPSLASFRDSHWVNITTLNMGAT